MNTIRNIFLIINLLLMTSLTFGSTGVPPRPNPPRLVNDFAGLLSRDEVSRLEQRLVAFNDSTSTQLAVVTLKSLDGYDIDDLAQRIGQEWKVGQKAYDNGIVILIKPRVGNEKGLAAISTGYGMEELIPDAIARRIVDNEMIPYFKENNYFGGINAGTDVVMDLVSGRFKASDYKKGAGPIGILIPIIIIALIAIFFGKNNNDKHHNIGRNGGLPFWVLMGMLGSSGRSSGSSWGGFSGGGGGFGGGGGGFGGFGGGSFGGGGASGSW